MSLILERASINTSELEKMFEQAETHVLSHHVSLGVSPGDPGNTSPPPLGSGTLVCLCVEKNVKVYGILTAAHVVKLLEFGVNNNREFLGLSKLLNGNTIACSVTFSFIFCIASKQGFYSSSRNGYKPDIAFIALGINGLMPNHELLLNSSFYDLDSNKELMLDDTQVFSIFYKGAGNIRPDGLLNTFLAIGGGEVLKYDETTNVQYWLVTNTSQESIEGGSGAGFWRCKCVNGGLHKSLEGVVIAEGINKDYFEALSPSYLYDTFLPELRNYCIENLSWLPKINSNG